jgi:sec-independent protein translocase protein TatA
MLGSLGWEELLVILAIVALISGASRVADLGGALGRGVREFREGVRGDDEAPDAANDDADTEASAEAPSEAVPPEAAAAGSGAAASPPQE